MKKRGRKGDIEKGIMRERSNEVRQIGTKGAKYCRMQTQRYTLDFTVKSVGFSIKQTEVETAID